MASAARHTDGREARERAVGDEGGTWACGGHGVCESLEAALDSAPPAPTATRNYGQNCVKARRP